jgi:hypothetical protein
VEATAPTATAESELGSVATTCDSRTDHFATAVVSPPRRARRSDVPNHNPCSRADLRATTSRRKCRDLSWIEASCFAMTDGQGAIFVGGTEF